MLERARDEEVMVYAIGLESEYFNGMRVVRSRPSRDLRKIADETGGGYFELRRPRSSRRRSRAWRRSCAASTDRICARRPRRQGAQARREGEQAGDDGAGA